MSTVKDKVIWITGASSGIGEALAVALAAKGARLILSARREHELHRVKDRCSSKENIHILLMDVTRFEEHHPLASKAISLFGRIDILINNAGITQRSFVKDTQLDVYKTIMNINYFGTISLTKVLLPHFLSRKTGHYVVISSITGKFGTAYRSGYAASKHALHGFYDSFRAELWRDVKDDIKVTLVCPGLIHTPITLFAVTGDGSPLNKMKTGRHKGKSADWCAQKIIKAIEKNKEEVNIGGREVMGVYLKRFFPRYFSGLIKKIKVR